MMLAKLMADTGDPHRPAAARSTAVSAFTKRRSVSSIDQPCSKPA